MARAGQGRKEKSRERHEECKRKIHRLCGWELGDQAIKKGGMRQSSYLPEAPEVFSKLSDGLDQYGK